MVCVHELILLHPLSLLLTKVQAHGCRAVFNLAANSPSNKKKLQKAGANEYVVLGMNAV